MKKAAFLTIAAVLLAISLPVFAQEFPDVPPDHWAYDAVQELVDAGIIQGYPDGTFGGKRAMTRYEFAEALAKAIPVIVERAGGAGGVGPAGPPGPQGPAGPAGPPGAGAEEVAALRQLVDEFRDELAALGVDVEALRRDVAALNERVTALEEEVGRVRFTGSANMIFRGEIENDGAAFDLDGRSLADAPGFADRLLEQSKFFNDFSFDVAARVSEGATLNASITAGDYMNWALNDVDDVGEFELWNLYLDTAARLGPLGAAQVRVGRMPLQLTPFTLKFVDPDSYTNVARFDSGNFMVDGGSATFNLGRIALTAFAAKSDDAIIDDLVTPDLMLGATGTEVTQLGGARAVIGTGVVGNLGLTWYQAGLAPGLGKANIFGADINTNFGKIGLSAEWAQSEPNDALEIAFPATADDTTAWNAKLSFNIGGFDIGAGYTTVESNFFAPGYWLDLGRAVNLRNVQGPSASLNYALGSNLSLTASGYFLEPETGTTVTARSSLNPGAAISASGVDKVTAWKAGLRYGLSAANSIDLGWEQVNWEPTTAGVDNTEERYITLGIGHSFNPNASLKLLYQIVDYDVATGGISVYGASDYRGGVAAAQFQLKY